MNVAISYTFNGGQAVKEVADMMLGLTVIAWILAHPFITILIVLGLSFILILPEILEELL